MKIIYSLIFSASLFVISGGAKAQVVSSDHSGQGLASTHAQSRPMDLSIYKAQLNSLQGFIAQADQVAFEVYNDPSSEVCAYEHFVLATADRFPSNLLNYNNLPSYLPDSLATDIQAASIELRRMIDTARNSGCSHDVTSEPDHCCKESTDPTDNSICKVHTGDKCVQMGTNPRGCSASGDDCP